MVPILEAPVVTSERDYAWLLRMAHGSKSARAERGETTLAFAPPSPPTPEERPERP